MPRLRPYQAKIVADIDAVWAVNPKANICMVLPTGGGKSVVLAHLMERHQGASICMAHRNELVGQLSMALARCGVMHRLIAQEPIVRAVCRQQLEEMGRVFVNASARVGVAGVQTLLGAKAQREHGAWFQSVTLVVPDEFHHYLAGNSYGRAVALFPHGVIVGPTATPVRTDGKGLGRHADGLADVMVRGPTGRQLIQMGYLVPYRIFCPPGDFDRSALVVSAGTRDFTDASVKQAVRKSHILGDIVQHYQRIAPGKLGLTFGPSVEDAQELTEQYLAQGVPAELLSGETEIGVRLRAMRRFAKREVLQICNCALISEGNDIPNLDVVSDGVPTQSFGKLSQKFGRMLRVSVRKELADRWDEFTDEERRAHIAASDKPYGIFIDHVGNIESLSKDFGLPDTFSRWTLDRRERRSSSAPSDVVPTTSCAMCTRSYERLYPACPYCGYAPEPVSRKGPEYVDGDLFELDAETLARMRGETADAQLAPSIPWGATPAIAQSLQNKHYEKMQARARLQETIDLWAGWRAAQGDTPSMAMRRFYHSFGTDVESTKSLTRADADKLNEGIRGLLTASSVRSTVPFTHNEEL